MTNDNIKKRLLAYLIEYQENAPHLKGLEVVFEYINFLKTEPYTKKLLANEFIYAQEQIELLKGYKRKKGLSAQDILTKPVETKGIEDLVVNQESLKLGLELKEKNQYATIQQALPATLANLVYIYEALRAGKEMVKNNEPINDEALNVLKEFPTATLRLKFGEEPIPEMTAHDLVTGSLAITSKYIIDSIDSKEIFGSKKTKKEPWFDKDESILHFMGEDIKITLKSEKPIDHYVLEAIFSKKDLTIETDFVTISEDFLKEDYNGKWNKFRNACDRLNIKIGKATHNKINDFITIHTGTTGWCRINPKYL